MRPIVHDQGVGASAARIARPAGPLTTAAFDIEFDSFDRSYLR